MFDVLLIIFNDRVAQAPQDSKVRKVKWASRFMGLKVTKAYQDPLDLQDDIKKSLDLNRQSTLQGLQVPTTYYHQKLIYERLFTFWLNFFCDS